MEFCTRRELENQTGHSIQEWPRVVAKELIDNALDACEEAEIAPVITVTVEPGLIIVEDNDGGIDADTVAIGARLFGQGSRRAGRSLLLARPEAPKATR